MAKISVSLDDDLVDAIRASAEGVNVSGWLADAAERKLRAAALSAYADEVEAATGPLTDDELARAVVAVICDTAVLIAADRRDRRAAALARAAADGGVELRVTAGCIAQAWRDGARQAPLAGFLAGCSELVLDGTAARSAGGLLGATGSADVVDASLASAATPGDTILTGDPHDIGVLVSAAGTSGVRVESFG